VSDVQAALERYRSVREDLERAVLALATSVDGRRFDFQASLHGLELEAGGYVTLDGEGSRRLGQVLSLEVRSEDAAEPGLPHVRVRVGGGAGVVLDGDGHPFHDVAVRPAKAEEIRAWLDRVGPHRHALEIGRLALTSDVPVDLDPGGFGRHTFVCGQSGSGKSYSLGVLLERLLMETRLRMVVLDPNSDFVRLGELRDGADVGAAKRFESAAGAIAVRSGTEGPDRIGVRFRDLDRERQAAVLRLDPLADRQEYAELLALLDDERVGSVEDLDRVGSEALRLRVANLGVDRWRVWPGSHGASLAQELDDRDGPRCLVVDLGSLGTREEQALTAGVVLERLWRRRARREPIAIVVDEAHDVCPSEPADALTALATRDVIRIAGEGRKFGLYLIVVSQRPQKVHENVISQCDNLVLMRLSSAADLDHLGSVFSSVARGLVDRAPTFAQGEALVAGQIVPHPTLVRFGPRLTREGGTDVGDW
jgi:uncharacterized protein